MNPILETLVTQLRSRKTQQSIAATLAILGLAFTASEAVPVGQKVAVWIAAMFSIAGVWGVNINGVAKEDAAKAMAPQLPAASAFPQIGDPSPLGPEMKVVGITTTPVDPNRVDMSVTYSDTPKG